MTPSLFHRWFGTGKIPPRYRADLEVEGLLHAEEGIRVATTVKQLKSPGRYTKRRTKTTTGSIAMTAKRMIGFGGNRTAIQIAFDHASFGKLSFEVEPDGALLIEYEAQDFYPEATGYVELRFGLANATEFLDRLRAARQAVIDKSETPAEGSSPE